MLAHIGQTFASGISAKIYTSSRFSNTASRTGRNLDKNTMTGKLPKGLIICGKSKCGKTNKPFPETCFK